jgi:hypothetical protein
MNGQIQAELKGVRMRRPNAWRISRRERVESHSTMPPLARATRSAASRVVPLAVSSHGEWDARAATHR